MDLVEKNKDLETEIKPDSQNIQELKETSILEEKKTAQSEDTAEEIKAAEKKETIKKNNQIKDISSYNQQELTEYLQALLSEENLTPKETVNRIKQLFYRKIRAENENLKKEFIRDGGEEINFIPKKDPFEDQFKELLNNYKTKRTEYQAKIEANKKNNLLQKQHILDRMKILVDNNEDVSAYINEFRDLQQKWKSIGPVPQQHVNKLWKSYSSLTESFWDLIKINNELREYDFRKNLEAKTALCEAAENLDKEEDIISAFRQLQQLHEKWRETGPVARDYREEIWKRFKEASTIINRKHQSHFDEIRKIEKLNYQLKTELCEKIESIDIEQLKSYKDWNKATKNIISWQEEWRSIGFAPRKLNNKIYKRYRAACDIFFEAKSQFYKDSKKQLAENLEKKKILCEKAEDLKDNTDWKSTSRIFIQLQKDWKTIGPVPRKYSEEIWKRFIGACDYFFEQRNKETEDQRKEEKENLVKKNDIINKINELNLIEDKPAPEILATLREYISLWNKTGFVPFKDKDKIHKEYRKALDKIFEKLNLDANQRKLASFKSNIQHISSKGEGRLIRERDKLMRNYDYLKSEIATYENNIGFLTSSDKKGSGLIKDMERKIETLKEEARFIEEKISLIDKQM